MKASYKIVFMVALAFFVVVILVMTNGEDGTSNPDQRGVEAGLESGVELPDNATASTDAAPRNPPKLLAADNRTADAEASARDADAASGRFGGSRFNSPSNGTAGAAGSGSGFRGFGPSTTPPSGIDRGPIIRPGQTRPTSGENGSADLANGSAPGSAPAASGDRVFRTRQSEQRVVLGNPDPPAVGANGAASAAADSADNTTGALGSAGSSRGGRPGAASTTTPGTANTAGTGNTPGTTNTPGAPGAPGAGLAGGGVSGDRLGASPSAAAQLPRGVNVLYVSPGVGSRKTHAIKTRENFAVLAERFYGSERYWRSIAQANPSVDPTKLQVGQDIRLPNASEIARFAPSTANAADRRAAPTPTTGQRHRVRSGQTLSSISKQHYGTTGLWKRIYDANRSAIGSNPDRLPAGEVLVIPPKP